MTCCFAYANHSGWCEVTCWSDWKWNISLLILLKSSLYELLNVPFSFLQIYMLLLLLFKIDPTNELDQRKQNYFKSWLEFSDGSMNSAVGSNDICFIFWQRILYWFWYLLILSNITDSRLIWWLITWSWWVKVFMFDWTDWCSDAKESLNSDLPGKLSPPVLWMLQMILVAEKPEDHTHVWYHVICQQSVKFCDVLKGRSQLRFWPFAVKLLHWELLLRWLKITIQRAWGSYWWSMWCILCWQLGFVPSTSRPEKPFEEQALLWRLLHSKRIMLLVFWIA